MKALIIGYGSIGKRHYKILSSLSLEVAVVSNRQISVDKLYNDLSKAINNFNPKYIIIANKTSEHYSTIQVLIENKFKGVVLIEKPIFHIKLSMPKNKFSFVYVGYNLRFHPLLLKLKEELSLDRNIISSTIYVGSYLPNWRANTDFKLSYSSKRSEGGGVLRDLSHELDIALWLFGKWSDLVSYGGRLSTLEIDSDDIYSILMKTRKCKLVNITMNYLDRNPKREIIVNTELNTYNINFIENTFNKNGIVEFFNYDMNDSYISQHKAVLNKHHNNLCSVSEAIETVLTIEHVEKSSVNKKWVNRKK